MSSAAVKQPTLPVTQLLLRGSLVAVYLLSILMTLYGTVTHSFWLYNLLGGVLIAVTYLTIGEFLLKYGHQKIVGLMLIVFYGTASFAGLIIWGLNAPIATLTMSFAIILPGLLFGARSIIPVALLTVGGLVGIQIIHSLGIIIPDSSLFSSTTSMWDVATYSMILAVFALATWLACSQREHNLERALQAEATLQAQKDALKAELEKESATLRQTQLNQLYELHKFAVLGQRTAATLHELSNHLSVLNIDIDDLHQYTKNSHAIENAKDSIARIHTAVRQARQHLNSYEEKQEFNIIKTLQNSIKDAKQKFSQKNIRISQSTLPLPGAYALHGNQLAFMQAVSILLSNACDACCNQTVAKVRITARSTKTMFYVSVVDNGPGVDAASLGSLFTPVISQKPGGMGVGLYITKCLIETQFNGMVEHIPSKKGAHFRIAIPK